MSSPRKFSEKIAIMERKLNEDEDAFSKVMGEVRAITGNAAGCPVQQQQQPQSIVSPTLEPGQWNRPGGSLPNMYEPSQQYWPDPTRGRSPGSHYHPYRVPRGHDRVPPLHGHLHYQQMGPPQHLIPPNDQWNIYGRAHSDTSINVAVMYGGPQLLPYHPSPYNGESLQETVQQLDEIRQEAVSSLPNMHNAPPQLPPMPGPSCYHVQVGQRHSTGCGTRLAPSFQPESQSAPTSPQQPHCLLPNWPNSQQNYSSNSPENIEIPNITVTTTGGRTIMTTPDELEGNGHDCYNNMSGNNQEQGLNMYPYDVGLQDLCLDSSEMHRMCNGVGSPMSQEMTSTASPDNQVYQLQ